MTHYKAHLKRELIAAKLKTKNLQEIMNLWKMLFHLSEKKVKELEKELNN